MRQLTLSEAIGPGKQTFTAFQQSTVLNEYLQNVVVLAYFTLSIEEHSRKVFFESAITFSRY